jgi:NAD(P)-dependent dehydrogenase (short-subunit alcohol dehydrogenase family)
MTGHEDGGLLRSDGSLARRRMLVVGASSGVGRAIGLAAAAHGAHVAFAARRLELLQTAVEAAGPPALALGCDVTDGTSVEQAVEGAASALGGIDAIVYATGVDPLVRIETVDAAAWSDLFATNVTGASLVTRAALPYLRAVRGRAVFISATSVGRPLPGMGAYATSKAALEELARAWRSEHPEVSFSTVAIGMTLGTEVTANWDTELLGQLASVWDTRGHLFDNGPGYMGLEEVAETVVSVLAAPTCLPFVSMLADPALQPPSTGGRGPVNS